MKKISDIIEKNKNKFMQHKFFHFLITDNIPLENKLAFLPDMSHFIMSFGDLNKYVIPFIAPNSELEKVVNNHAKEDANHWPWFINDLQKLRMNKTQSFTDTLNYLWSDGLSASRRLTYTLISLISNKNAKSRIALIEVMEATGNVMFTILGEMTNNSTLNLEFCGNLHSNHESGHTMGTEKELIDQIDFTDKEYDETVLLINEGFRAFSLFMDELYQKVMCYHGDK